MTPVNKYAGSERPFIGLRPFSYEDRDYFFGRDEQLDALEPLVTINQFVAIVGSSGSGKSSLIRAGLLPRLEKLSSEGTRAWLWTEARPRQAPISELARALAGLDPKGRELSDAWRDRIEIMLRRSSFGICDSLSLLASACSKRLLILIDQFEELFRFADLRAGDNLSEEDAAHRDEATAFVRLLLTAVRSQDIDIHIVVTMRSDFIGDCARFHGLPEAVTASQFLVPGLTRDQRAEAITLPVQHVGGQIDPGLVQRALNDTNEDPDQLPVLQHTLMRCWQLACARRKDVRGPVNVTLEDYLSVGGVARALSKHANEICDELTREPTTNKQSIPIELAIKRIFQALTAVDPCGRVARRPQLFGDLVNYIRSPDANNGSQKESERKGQLIVGRFSDPTCSFLRAPMLDELQGDSIVDIGHEALIRRWDKLKGIGEGTDWVREEQDDAERYCDLVRTAKANSTIPEEELPAIERWWSRRRPNRFWAQRYTRDHMDYFDEVRQVLKRSRSKLEETEQRGIAAERAQREAAEANLRAQAAEAAAKLRAQRNSWITLFLCGAAIAAAVSLYLGIRARYESDRAAAAEAAKQEILYREKAFRSKVFGLASNVTNSPPKAVGAADALSIALAKTEAYPDVFEYQQAVYRALTDLREKRRIVGLPGPAFSVAVAPSEPLVSALIPGKPVTLHFWRRDDGAFIGTTPVEAGSWSMLRWSPDGERLLVGSNPVATVLTPCSIAQLRKYFKTCDGKLEDVILRFGSVQNPAGQGIWSPDGKTILTGGFRQPAKFWNGSSGAFEGIWDHAERKFSSILSDDVYYEAATGIAFSFDSARIAIGAPTGEIAIVNAKNYRLEKTLHPSDKEAVAQTFSLAFSPKDSNTLLSTSQNATGRLWDVSAGTEHLLKHDRGTVYQGKFGPEGDFLVTASEDGAIRMWLLAPVRGPIILRGHRSTTYSVDVASDGTIISGSSDKTVRLWDRRSPLSPSRSSQTFSPTSTYEVNIEGSSVIVKRSGVVEFRAEWSENYGEPLAASVTADGEFIVIAPKGGGPLLYRRAYTKQPLAQLRGSYEWKGISFMEGETEIAAVSSGGKVHVWPFYSDFNTLKRMAEGSLPLEGTERIKVSDEVMCQLTSREGDCPVEGSFE